MNPKYTSGDELALLDAALEERTKEVEALLVPVLAEFARRLKLEPRKRTKHQRAWSFRSWYGRMGLVADRESSFRSSEYHYRCAVCGENLHSQKPGGVIRSISQNRMRLHVAECVARAL